MVVLKSKKYCFKLKQATLITDTLWSPFNESDLQTKPFVSSDLDKCDRKFPDCSRFSLTFHKK